MTVTDPSCGPVDLDECEKLPKFNDFDYLARRSPATPWFIVRGQTLVTERIEDDSVATAHAKLCEALLHARSVILALTTGELSEASSFDALISARYAAVERFGHDAVAHVERMYSHHLTSMRIPVEAMWREHAPAAAGV